MVDKESPFYKPKHFTYLFVKRIFDLIFSLIGIIGLIPLAIIVKIIYVCNGDFNSIFYAQTRVGYRGRLFPLIKFRTMVPNAEEKLQKILEKNPKLKQEWEENQKLDNDPRITKVGHFLRRASIDETPQFLNVFLGQLSLIGPRPLIPGELKQHKGKPAIYESVKPGITGYWATYIRNTSDYAERLKLEYFYVENQTLSLDCKIFARTIKSMLKKTGK